MQATPSFRAMNLTATMTKAPFAKTIAAKVALITAITLSAFAISTQSHAADIISSYANTCGVCHDQGNLGAPKKGDKATWQRLLTQKGMDGLVKSTKDGMPQMPARGLCNHCSDADFAALIEHMAK